MSTTAILEKLRKLLALAKSDNANEAAAAAAAAQRLMTEHQISEAELEVGGPQEQASVADDPLDTFGARSQTWKEVLSTNIARLHGCKVWREKAWVPAQRRWAETRIRIVGRPSDVATVRYLYAWLTTVIERLVQANARGRGQRYAYSYRVGAVNGCIEAMQAAHREAREQATETALVKVDARLEEAEAETARTQGHIRPARGATFKRDPDAYQRGLVAGRSLHTGAQLGVSTGGRLLNPAEPDSAKETNTP